MQRFLLLLSACLALRADGGGGGGPVAGVRHPALAALPAHMLWAWERPEDLRWLPPEAGVAFVASTIVLRGGEAIVRPRTAPLMLPAGAAVVPVLHVDASWRQPPELSARQSRRIADELLRVAERAGSGVVQLDFEVRRSQRPFLAGTLAEIRRRLDPRIALSVTALASWCLDDGWLPAGVADEVVPMAFRMGPGEQALRARLRRHGFTLPLCRQAAGYASDEPALRVPHGGRGDYRSYYFSPRSWTAASWQAMRSQPWADP